jgi:hypothetical protein
MKRIALTLACASFGACLASTEEDPWVNDPPMSLMRTYAMPELDTSQFTEVPVSLADEAYKSLEQTPVLAIDEHNFQRFYPPCSLPRKVYLVRAVYEHGTSGLFHVKQLGSVLWVFHYALGPYAPRHRSALAVCIASEPTTIYVSALGAL